MTTMLLDRHRETQRAFPGMERALPAAAAFEEPRPDVRDLERAGRDAIGGALEGDTQWLHREAGLEPGE
jgi:hypothetical protein